MKKQHYTAEIPVSNPYNFAAFRLGAAATTRIAKFFGR